ncbi:MAG: DinB family protein [Bryobacteraceae bacterium]|jgi:uncharacterized damage-inducible protein DinB
MNTQWLYRVAVLFLLGSLVGLAQQPAPPPTPPANPLGSDARMAFEYLTYAIAASAEKMPAENYAFKPVPEVRSFAQILGHIADSQYSMCAPARGVSRPEIQVEKTKTAKADLVAALKEAVAFCKPAYEGFTDAKAAETVKLFGGDHTRLGVLYFSNLHVSEHYGNLVTYMRMKGIVPPTSEPRPKQ